MRRLTLVLFLAYRSCVFARDVPITILNTCDLHGHLLPTEDYEGHRNLGGLARCATTIQQIRSQQRNVLLVDAGDTIQGTAASFLSGGQVMVKALNFLRYDAWIWGNHEFDWGLNKLAACADRAEMPILNANLQAGQILPQVKPYRVMDVDGVKVGIIGLNTPGVPNWSRPRLIDGLKFTDSVETLKSVVPEIRRAGAQVLVLVCHQGYREGGDDHANQINAIARNFPELDVIIAGHTHRNFPEYQVNRVLYCQAGYYGIHLGRVDLVYDTVAGKVTHRESRTLLMDARVPLDAGLLEQCAPEIASAEKVLSTKIGEATGEFSCRGGPKHETSIHDLLFRSVAAAVPVDVVIHGLLNPRASLKRGPITMGDVWQVVPYENTIGVMQLTPAQLREVLEENAGAYEKREFRGVWGVKWSFDPRAPASKRVVTLQCSTNRLAVAFNSYELASGGLRWSKVRTLADDPETKLVEYDLQTRQVVIDFIRNCGQISPKVSNWWSPARSR